MKKEILIAALCGVMMGCGSNGGVEKKGESVVEKESAEGSAAVGAKEGAVEVAPKKEEKGKKVVPTGRYVEMVGIEEERYPLMVRIEGEEVSVSEARGDVGMYYNGSFRKKEEGRIECAMSKGGTEEEKAKVVMEFEDRGDGRVGVRMESGEEDLRRYCGRWIDLYSQNDGEKTVWKAMYAKGAGSMLGLLKDVAAYRNDWNLMTLARYMEKPSGLDDGDKATVDYKNNYGHFVSGETDRRDEVKVWKTKGGLLMGVAHTFELNCNVYFYRYDKEAGTIERVAERLVDVNVGGKACDVLYHFPREFDDVKVELVGLDEIETYKWNGEGFEFVR